MESAENKRAVIVGVFISLGIVLFVLGVFTLGTNQKTFGGSVTVNAVFDDVSGLKKGNSVWFSGVKVGTINKIEFAGIGQVKVALTIDNATQPYVHKDATLRIGAEGFIGNKLIEIEGGSPSAPAVQEGDVLHTVKQISTDEIMATLQKNNENILVITGDLKKLTKSMTEGKGMVGTLLSDTAVAMKFRAIVQNLDNTTMATNRMAQQLGTFGTKLNSKGTLADKLLTDTSTYRKLQASVDNFQKTSKSASTFIENLNQASSKMQGTNSIIGILLNDQQKAQQMQSTLNYLHQSSVKLNDDLEAAQHNFLLRGFFKKRQKAVEDSLKRVNGK